MARLSLPYGFTNNEAFTLDFTNGSIAGALNTFANMSGMTTSQTDRWRCNWTSAAQDQHMGVKYEFPADQDFSSYHSIEVTCGWPQNQGLYLLGSIVNRVQLYFVKQTGTAFTDYYLSPAIDGGVLKQVDGKMVFNFPKTACTVGAGTPNWNQIRRIEIRILANTNGIQNAGSFDIYGLRFLTKPPRTYVCLSFDDNYQAQYDEAYLAAGRMKDLGFRGGVALNGNSFGVTGKMSDANLLALQTAGWEMHNHTVDHAQMAMSLTMTLAGTTATANSGNIDHGLVPDDRVEIYAANEYAEYAGVQTVLTTPLSNTFTFTVLSSARTPITGRIVANKLGDTARIRASITDNSARFASKGLTESKVFVYPYGSWSPQVQALLQSMGYTAARGTGNRKTIAALSQWHSNLCNSDGTPDLNYDLSGYSLGNTETANSVLTALDNHLPYGGIFNIYGHNFVAVATTSTEFAISELALLLTGLKTRQQQGLIDVIPMGEALSKAKAGRAF